MQVWFGIGDHEVQVDLRGEGLKLCLPKPGSLHQDGCALLPSGEDEVLWEFLIKPFDRGYGVEKDNRCWVYDASYLWQNPNTQEVALSETRITLCRDADAMWAICVYPEVGIDLLLALPLDVAKGLEEAFQSHPVPWVFVPRVIEGGAREE